MGNAASKYTAYDKLDAELPVAKKMEYDENYLRVDKSLKVFADDKDREQFICTAIDPFFPPLKCIAYSLPPPVADAVIAISTSNGALDLSGADYRLFYSRRETREDAHLFASIVALKDGVIVAKIEPYVGGKDQREAFLALRKDVEVKLDGILQVRLLTPCLRFLRDPGRRARLTDFAHSRPSPAQATLLPPPTLQRKIHPQTCRPLTKAARSTW